MTSPIRKTPLQSTPEENIPLHASKKNNSFTIDPKRIQRLSKSFKTHYSYLMEKTPENAHPTKPIAGSQSD
jgi:hypothetical protein